MSLSSSNVSASTPPIPSAATASGGVVTSSASVAHAARPPVVHQESVELAVKLRAGTLQSTDELARGLGLSTPLLQNLVGVYLPSDVTATVSAFRLLAPDTGTAQKFSFNGDFHDQVDDATDATLLKEAFAAYGLTHRRDIDIARLCEKFTDLTVVERRLEWAARFGPERERLQPLATDIWFWQQDMTADTLAKNIKSLVARSMPLPPLPEDLSPVTAAQQYATACTALKAQAEQWQPLERSFLEDLAAICASTFDPAIVKTVTEEQRKEIADAADMAHFSRRVESIREGIATMLPLVDTQTDFESPWRTELGNVLGNYPRVEDWTGEITMNKTKLQKVRAEITSGLDKLTGLSDVVDALEERYASHDAMASGSIKEIDDAFSNLGINQNTEREKITSAISALPHTYQRSKLSVKALNELLQWGFMMLHERSLQFMLAPMTGTLERFKAVLNPKNASSRQVLAARFAADAERRAPEIIRREFIPKMMASRDFHEVYHRFMTCAPQLAAKSAEDIHDRLFGMEIGNLIYIGGIEEHIADRNWNVVGEDKVSRSDRVRLVQALATQSLELRKDQHKDMDDVFVEDAKRLIDFSRDQLYTLGYLAGVSANRGLGQVGRKTFETLRNNMTLAMRAFGEMATTYACLRHAAGKPATPDEVMGALARRAFILETATSLVRNVERRYAETGAISVVPVEAVQPAIAAAGEAEVWQPEVVEIAEPEIEATARPQTAEPPQVGSLKEPDSVVSVPVAASSSASVPVASVAASRPTMTDHLKEARDHGETGKKEFAAIALSSSQLNNPFRARAARDAFQAAYTLLTDLRTELADMDPVQRPRDMPGSQRLKKEAEDAELWAALMTNLLTTQSRALRWPTSHGAMERLFEDKSSFEVRRPQPFLKTFYTTDARTGAVKIDPIVELEIDLFANARLGDRNRKEVVQTVFLHLHYKPSLALDKNNPADLLKIEPHHILKVHVKPWAHCFITRKNAPRLLDERGAPSTQKVDVSRGNVPEGIALRALEMAAGGRKPKKSRKKPPQRMQVT